MSQPSVGVAYEGAELALVTIQRPERSNALDSATAHAVVEAIEEASSRARVIILTGAGRAFCAGGDLAELERWSSLPAEQIGAALYSGFQGMIRAIRAASAVVIAAINGPVVAA